ncbi:Ribonuclease D [hydrothermal vent metagenome]|uniref:Ribonuclease D n=1 Tax=hydrothermal vent metagenome TaxID=652676 RepID=A0A1W1BTJ9_9ZZZZ
MIDSNQALKTFFDEIKNSSWIALDTEFVRVNTYYPKFCLLQIATETQAKCIDILAITDISLFDFLYQKNLIWVVHSARQDIEVLFNLTNKLPYQLFDTQIAASFLKFDRQVAYKTLVQEYCNIELQKGYARFDWSIRPLPNEVLKYALDDVIYLAKIYPMIKNKLIEKNFLSWVEEDNKKLLDKKLYENNPLDSWKKVKIPNIKIPELVFERLCYFALAREIKAQQKNKPRLWIKKDKEILENAFNLNKDTEIILKLKKEYPILRNIKQPICKNKPLNKIQKQYKKELQKQIEIKASEYNLPIENFLTNKQLNSFVQGNIKNLTTGWRAKILKEIK